MASASQDTSAVLGGAANGFAAGGPVGAAVGALAAIPTLFQTSLTGMEKQDATAIVNGAEPLFRENVTLFQQDPTYANQQQGIQNFLAMWAAMVAKLESIAVSAGAVATQSINDRAPGGKVDWWKLYLDPIQNATVRAPSSPVTSFQLSSPTNYWTQPAAGAQLTPTPIVTPNTPGTGRPSMGPLFLLAAFGLIGYGLYEAYA